MMKVSAVRVTYLFGGAQRSVLLEAGQDYAADGVSFRADWYELSCREIERCLDLMARGSMGGSSLDPSSTGQSSMGPGSVNQSLADRSSVDQVSVDRILMDRPATRRTGSGAVGEGSQGSLPAVWRFLLTVHPGEEIVLQEVRAEIPLDLAPSDRIFVNGFQSWTESREFEQNERIPRLKWPASALLKRYGDYEFYRYTGRRGVFHGWTYSYIRRSGKEITLLGSLSEMEGYTLFEFEVARGLLTVSRDCAGVAVSGGYKALDFMMTTCREDDAFDLYFGLMHPTGVGQVCGSASAPSFRNSHGFGADGYSVTGEPSFPVPVRRGVGAGSPLTGWTSWYKYYTRVTSDCVLRDLAAFKEKGIPIGLFQIDDGWERAVGDWLIPSPGKFPAGMSEIVGRIKEAGYMAGLWLAPFVCERKSRVWKEHPDWVLRDAKGRSVKAGFNPGWSGWFYALDVYNEGFREYLGEVFKRVLGEWGFDLVKLDFLYAAALLPRRTKTRGRVMCEAMRFLRDLVGAKIILGCGVPLGPAFGIVEYCRIGSDVSLAWEDRLLKAVGYRERVSTINSITSTVGRHHLDGRAFYNDPDVIILRSKNTKLTPSQRMTLFRVNASLGGVVLTSDAPSEYGEPELQTYLSLLKQDSRRITGSNIRDGIAYVGFETGARRRLLLANLMGTAREVSLRPESLTGLDSEFITIFSKFGRVQLGAYESVYLEEAPADEVT